MYIKRAQQPIRFPANIKINLFNLKGKYLIIDDVLKNHIMPP